MKHPNSVQRKVTVLACMALLASCHTDERYSYDKIRKVDTDMTLFENGISLPLLESTAQLRVDSLMHLAGLDTLENIVLQDDGSYRFEMHDSFDLADQIKELDLEHVVSISALDHTERISFNLGIDTSLLPSSGSVTVPTLEYDATKTLNFNVMSADDIPDMLVSVSEVGLNDVSIKVNLTTKDLPGNEPYILNAEVDFPSFIIPNKVTFSDISVNSNSTVSRSVVIDKLDLSGFDFPALKAAGSSVGGDIVLNINAKAENITLDVSDILDEIDADVEILISDSNSEISVKNVTAKVDYQLDTTLNIPFVTLPSYLEGARISLPDVSVDLTARTNLALPLDCTAALRSKGASEDAARISLNIPYSTSPSVTLSETTHNEVNINDILRDMPDSISFGALIATDVTRDCYVETAADYALKIDYLLSAPLRLGSDSYIPYRDTVKIGSDTGKTVGKLLQDNALALKGHVDNGLPLSVSVDFTFLSYDENTGAYTEIPLSSEVRTELLKASSESDFTLSIGAEKGNTALENLTHLLLSLEITSDGNALVNSESVKVSSLSFTLPEGLNIDPSDLK